MSESKPRRVVYRAFSLSTPAKGRHKLRKKLEALASALIVKDRGVDKHMPTIASVYLETSWTEAELQEWCGNLKPPMVVSIKPIERKEDR